MRLVQDVQRRAARGSSSAAASASTAGVAEPAMAIAVAAARRDGVSTAASTGESFLAIIGDETDPEVGTVNRRLIDLIDRLDAAGIP